MNLPIKIVYDLLMNDPDITSLINPDMIFMLDVPEDDRKNEQLPIIRINEINDYHDGFASDVPYSVVMSVQVDVWSKSIQTLGTIRNALDELMSHNDWSQYNGGIDKDPDFNDTPRLYRRYRTTEQIRFI